MTSIAALAACIVFIVAATTWLKIHPFLALLMAAFGYGVLSGMPLAEVVNSVNDGFGKTMGSIGVVIIAGTIIGVFLENSGGASRLARAVLGLTGERHSTLGMGIIGYIVSLPVFCDSGFVILSSLNKAVARASHKTLAAGAIALSLGLYATHTMVPPTPGPVAAAGILDADLGRVIVYGMLVAAVAMLAGWLFAVFVAGRVFIDPDRPSDADAPAAGPAQPPPAETAGPPTLLALAPIVVPLVLIVLQSVSRLPEKPLGEGFAAQLVQFVGQPVVALLAGVGLALLLPKKFERRMLSGEGWVGRALADAATIIFITCAGGAFGKVLQNSDIAQTLGGTMSRWPLGIWLPFLIAAAIKTVQGSSTVALMTTAGIMAPLLGALGLDGAPGRALAVIAIGAGSMVVSHVNDSYFWVVTRFSHMTLAQGYRLQTLGTLVEGCVAATAVWALSLVVL
ncbi:MAG: GntP family permease [Planctomycetes bacterium]|nr:GntP family permease [Planctomycetota bacterium]